MGRYLNPENTTKEHWLLNNAIPCHTPPMISPDEDGYYAVCLVDNGWMTAAGLCHDVHELRAFRHPGDYRPKRWFKVTAEQAKLFK